MSTITNVRCVYMHMAYEMILIQVYLVPFPHVMTSFHLIWDGFHIKRVFLSPQPVQPLPNAVKAIEQANLIVISPGSLYTSILPNLIIPKIDKAMRETKAKVVYVCNVMTQAGETTGYSASDHVQAIHDHIGKGCVDAIVVQNEPIKQKVRAVYAEENASPVIYDTERLLEMGLEIIEGDIIDHSKPTLRHNTDKIAKVLYSMLGQNSERSGDQ